jgi:hypothetical protein
MTGVLAHRHGASVHAHVHSGPHRHLLRPRRSQALGHHAREHRHGHSHGLVDDTIKRSRDGLRAVALALAVLGLTAAAQTLVFLASGSVALLADLIHNFGDASTAVPLGVAFGASKRAGGALGRHRGGAGHLCERLRRWL